MVFATAYPGKILTDPSRKIYGQLLFKRSLSRIFTPHSLVSGVKAVAGGHRQGGLKGDALQLGGAVVINREGKLLHYHACKDAAEQIDCKLLLQKALEELAAVD